MTNQPNVLDNRSKSDVDMTNLKIFDTSYNCGILDNRNHGLQDLNIYVRPKIYSINWIYQSIMMYMKKCLYYRY